jgi:hypothetical protein
MTSSLVNTLCLMHLESKHMERSNKHGAQWVWDSDQGSYIEVTTRLGECKECKDSALRAYRR